MVFWDVDCHAEIAGFECPGDKQQTFLWNNDPLGLAVLAYPSGAKAFIYQAKVKQQTMRLTIGDVKKWGIAKAEAEARRLQTVIDTGNDPREVIADANAAKEAKAAALTAKQARETVLVSQAWLAYMEDRKPHWGERHYNDHASVSHAGGEQRQRSGHSI